MTNRIGSASNEAADMQPATDSIPQAEHLRSVEEVLEPDPRNSGFAAFDTGAFRPVELGDRHAAISEFVLNDAVPAPIRIHFETARNLYLYAWFVYRFFSVAEQQVLGTLEFALRMKLRDYLPAERTSSWDGHPPALHRLMKIAIGERIVSCEGLRIREQQALATARERVSDEKLREMIEQGLGSIAWDDSTIEPLPRDYRDDWLDVLSTTLPQIRNALAHGSQMLHPTVLGTFAHVTDLINQLYTPSSKG